MIRSLKLRFEEKYIPATESGCWLWIAGKNWCGYGKIYVNGKTEGAHRISYQLYVGPIPDGLCVLHRCDVPSCVNPEHLFLGTNKDNTQDMVKKGRSARGEAHWSSKLTTKDVCNIRISNDIQIILAKRYGASQSTISDIKTNKIWSSI